MWKGDETCQNHVSVWVGGVMYTCVLVEVRGQPTRNIVPQAPYALNFWAVSFPGWVLIR